jgi:Tfp pilus assembly protein PilF
MKDAYRKASAAARHALELDDSSAEAYATLGLIGLNQPDAWIRTEPEFRRAIQINPNFATAHHWYAYYLLFSGRENEALAEVERARDLDPLSIIINADKGAFLYDVRRYEEAKVPLRRAIELAPEFGQPHETLALIALETGHASEALKEARAALSLAPTNPRTIGEAGYVLAATGQSRDAGRLLATLKNMIRHGAASPVYAALIHMGMGQRSAALDALEETRRLGMTFQGIGQWHAFDELKNDPRFRRIVS